MPHSTKISPQEPELASNRSSPAGNARDSIIMAPTIPSVIEPEPTRRAGPDPSYIQVAKPYLFQQQIQDQLIASGANLAREDAFRLQGVQWINDVRLVLQLPVRTFATACCYYHKFRLVHKDNEYQYQDAAAAALFTACKVEDTLKKSRDILCAAHNLKVFSAEHISPDDNAFDGPSKIITGLERLMLEASGFDFRCRYPHKHLIKLAKEIKIDQDIAKLSYSIMIDLYRTYAPLKQTCATMAFACLELATLVSEKQNDAIRGPSSPQYEKWFTTRGEIMETILDLLDLYNHFQKSSVIGPLYHIDRFINTRIKLNQEVEEGESLNRYTEMHSEIKSTNGAKTNIKTPNGTPITPASPADFRANGKDGASPATLSPRSSGSRGFGPKSQEGTVRFMLDAEQAKQEKEMVGAYFKLEYEDHEVEVEEIIAPSPDERGPREHRDSRDHRDHREHRSNRDRRETRPRDRSPDRNGRDYRDDRWQKRPKR